MHTVATGHLGVVEGTRGDMLARARLVLDSDLAADDPATAVIAAIRAATRIAIPGGGTLDSSSSRHIIECWTISQLAVRADVPYVIAGQTLGPELTAEDAFLLSELLELAELVEVPDLASFKLADTLGVAYDRLQMKAAS